MPENLQPLLNLGVAGCMLIWFMLRLEALIKDQTSSNNRLAKTNLMVLLKLNHLGVVEADEIKGLLDEIIISESKK